MPLRKRKITESKHIHYRTWKKGKTWCYGCGVLATLVSGVVLSSQTINANANGDNVSITSISEVKSTSQSLESSNGPESSYISSFEVITEQSTSESKEEIAVEEKTTTSTSATSINKEFSDSTKVANVVVDAVSADIKLTQQNSTAEQSANTTLPGNQMLSLGAKGTFTADTSDLIAGNTIVIAKVDQTTDSSGALVKIGATTSPVTLKDNNGNVVGTIQYDTSKKAITLIVTNSVTEVSDSQTYSFTGAQVMVVNTSPASETISKLPFSNSLSVSGNNYNFDFTKISSSDATTIRVDGFSHNTAPGHTSFNGQYFHEDIPDNNVFNNELQASGGTIGSVLENSGILKSLEVSSSSEALAVFANSNIALGTYYVSAATNKVQALTGQTNGAIATRSIPIPTVNGGSGLSIPELQTLAKTSGTGVYYSLQESGSYLVVEYVNPADTILTDAQIENLARANVLAGTSTDIEADVKATIAYYHGVLKNRASYVQIGTSFTWADEYSPNTLTTQTLDNDGNPVGKPITSTSSPNGIASGTTPVKVHYVDINGNTVSGTLTKPGTPTGKENSLGGIVNGQASVSPITVPGYTLVSSVESLSAAQKSQLENTMSGIHSSLSSSKADSVSDQYIFATKADTVPYPGMSGTFYDANGKIVTDGSGTEGYGQTDVYYFYVANPQKVVYNVFDDGRDADGDGNGDNAANPTQLGSPNAEYANGYTGENVVAKDKTLDEIIAEYIGSEAAPGKYELVSSDPVPGVYDSDDTKDQVINIHLKHRVTTKTEEEKVSETIHYVFEDGTEAAPDNTDNSVTFTRSYDYDEADAKRIEDSEDAWTPVDANFPEEASPEIAGYTPDKASVAEQPGIAAEDLDSKYEFTVTYKADEQKVVYNVIDDDETDSVKAALETGSEFENGITGAALTKTQDDLDTIIKGYTDKGYELVSSDPVPTNFDNDTTVDQAITIHLKHHLTTTTETKEVDETIHYVYEDGSKAADDKTDKVTFTRDTVTDDVTKEVVSQTEWTAKDDDTTFGEKVSPEIDGYTADKASIVEVTGLTVDSKDVEETVTYKKNAEPDKPTPPVDTPTPPSETPTPKPVELPKGSPAEIPAQKGSILPSPGEERTAVAVLGGALVAVAGIIGLMTLLRRRGHSDSVD
jgi:uncharacterized protein YtpQ (UPF0354 family)